MSILQVTVETVSGKEHEFFFNGDLRALDSAMSSGPINCCDRMGLPTTKTKSFHPNNISCCTTIEVEPTPEPVFTKVSINNVFTKEQQKMLDWVDKANIGD